MHHPKKGWKVFSCLSLITPAFVCSFRLIVLIFLVILGVVGSYPLRAQDFIPSIASPEAHAFTKFGEIPVSYYSGVPNIEIPVYHLKDGSAKLPITLRYHAGGIKVSEQASWVGLGWNLDVGGVVTRTIKGMYDYEQCMGRYMDPDFCFPLGSSPFPANYTLGYTDWASDLHLDQACITASGGPECDHLYTLSAPGCSKIICEDNLMAQEMAALGYFQPDIFDFNFMGYSGKFYYNFQEQKFHVIKNESLVKVEPIGTYFNLTGFKITIPSGVVYTFSDIQKKTSERDNFFWQVLTSESFFLSAIDYPDGNYLRFAYTTESVMTNDQYYVAEQYTYNGQDTQAPEGTVTHNTDFYYPMYLTEINSPNLKISFTLSATNQRLDIKKGKYLSFITVLDKLSAKTRSFTFTYDYFANSTIGGSILNTTFLGPTSSLPTTFDNSEPLINKRLKLVSFSETGVTPYTFHYNSIPLPSKTSHAVDHWGYYNGVNNTTQIPRLKNLLSSINLSNAIPTLLLDLYNVAADRGPDSVFMKAGVLEKITYPTGGATEFQYEPHTFDNFDILPANWQGNIIESYNVAKNRKASETAVTYPSMLIPQAVSGSSTFFLNFKMKGTKGGVQPGESHGTLQSEREDEIVKTLKDARINLIQYSPAGSFMGVIKTWQFPENLFYGGFRDLDSDDLLIEDTLTLSRNYHYGLSITMSYAYASWDYVGGDTKIESSLFNTVREPHVKETSYGGGLRVKRIKNFARAGDAVPAAVKSYSYSAGVLMLPLKYISQMAYYQCGGAGPQEWASTISNSQSFTSNLGSIGQFVGYDEVSERLVDPSGTLFNGQTKYYFHNEALIHANTRPAIESKTNGTLYQKSTFDQSGSELTRSAYFHKYLNGLHYAGYVCQKYLMLPHTLCNQPNYPRTSDIHRAWMYYIYDNNLVPDFTMEYTFSGGNERVSSTVFTYNTIGQVIKESAYAGNYSRYLFGDIPIPQLLSEIKTFYPANAPSGYSLSNYGDMTTKYNLFPLKQENYRNGQKVSEKTFAYQNYTFPTRFNPSVNASSYFPLSILEKPTASATAADDKLSEFVFSNGNVVQAKGPDGIPITFLWDYNLSFPVAKIMNATYSSVSAQVVTCAAQCAPGQTNCDQKWKCVRAAFPDAQVTNYAYQPLDGVVSITDPNGQKSAFTYDSVSRLISILDQDGNYRQVFDYHYQD